MGRNKQPSAPKFSDSLIRVDGKDIGKTYMDPKTKQVVTEYFSDPEEIKRKNEAQTKLTGLYAQLGQHSDLQLADAENYKKNYIDEETKTFNDLYNPLIRNTREDNAARFGSLDNSVFKDDMNEIEKSRSYGIADIARRATLAKQDYLDQFNDRIMQQIAALEGNIGTYNNNAYQAFGQSNQNSEIGTNYSMQNYQALLNNLAAKSAARGQMTSNIVSGAASAAGIAAVAL